MPFVCLLYNETWSLQSLGKITLWGTKLIYLLFIKSVRLCCTFCGKRNCWGKSSLVLDFPAVCVEMPTWPSLSTTTIRPYMKPSFCLYVLWQCLQHCPFHSHAHGLQPCPPSRVGMNVLTLFFVSVSVIYISSGPDVSQQRFIKSVRLLFEEQDLSIYHSSSPSDCVVLFVAKEIFGASPSWC